LGVAGLVRIERTWQAVLTVKHAKKPDELRGAGSKTKRVFRPSRLANKWQLRAATPHAGTGPVVKRGLPGRGRGGAEGEAEKNRP